MTLRAVIFDFDGVLANTEPLHLAAWQHVLAEEQITLTDSAYYKRYLGFDDETMIALVAEEAGRAWDEAAIRALVARKSRRFEQVLDAGNVLFPGAADATRRLAASVPLAVASGAFRDEIELILERAGVRACFRAIVAAGETARGKPAPDPYNKAVNLLAPHLGPAHPSHRTTDGIVAIEDSRWGVEAAQAAGLRCVALTHSYPAADLGAADLVLDTLDEITIDRLAGVCR